MLCCIKRFEKLVKVMISSLRNQGLGVALLRQISVGHTIGKKVWKVYDLVGNSINNFDRWIKLGMVTSGWQLRVMKIVILRYKTWSWDAKMHANLEWNFSFFRSTMHIFYHLQIVFIIELGIVNILWACTPISSHCKMRLSSVRSQLGLQHKPCHISLKPSYPIKKSIGPRWP
jgi:hypothetical protein